MAHIEKKSDDHAKTKAVANSSDSEVKSIPIGDGEPESASPQIAASEVQVEATTQPDPIQVLETKVAELEDQRLRALADLENYRKRMTRQFDEVVRSANDRLLTELLDVADNFERSIAHTNDQGDVDAARLAALKQGTELIYGQLRGLLDRYDVKPLESIGFPFDPRYHEALAQIESDRYDEGIVAAEINKGYLIGERVLRHARVAVSKGSPQKKAEKQDKAQDSNSG
ncbi:MAG: nucleotide exchange factor GrpE [candidate division Zixibacteria bacterium]|nr:nucleotide exchange factor GrpE [candidate division Zixibacteria bacterium]